MTSLEASEIRRTVKKIKALEINICTMVTKGMDTGIAIADNFPSK